MKPLQHLKQLVFESQKEKYPNMPEHALVINTFDTTRNKETKQLKRIELFLLLSGDQAERIDNKGTRIDNRKVMYNPLGANQTVGSVEYRKSKMTNGTADLSATIGGRSVKIELKRIYKNGRDRQSDDQKRYQADIIKAGGIYVITHSYDDFYTRIYPHLKNNPFISQDELNKLILI